MQEEIHAPVGQIISIKNRESVMLEGVEEVMRFDEAAVTCRTTLGDLVIEGSSLRITRFCEETGEMSLIGKISGLFFEDRKEKGVRLWKRT